MTNEEAIEMFKVIIMAEIERLPHHYDAEVDDDVYDDISRVDELLQLNKIVSKALEKQMQNCGNCLRADRVPNYHMVYCRVHNSVTSDDNYCRYWEGEDDE